MPESSKQIPLSQIKKRGTLFYYNGAVLLFIRHGVLGNHHPCKAINLTEYKTADASIMSGTTMEIAPNTLVDLVEADFYIEKTLHPILRVFNDQD